jgi:hypothetical protein
MQTLTQQAEGDLIPQPVRKQAAKVRNRWREASRAARWTLITLVVLLVVARALLPWALEGYVNRQLDKAPGYRGAVGDVDVHLWRGAYRIHDVSLHKITADIPVPLFAARSVDLSMEWKELFHGSLVGEVVMEQPGVNFVAGPTPEQSQSGKNQDWKATLESLFPFKLNRVEIREGQVHFQNFHSTPPVNISVSQLFAIATNLTNSRDLAQPLPAGVTALGRVPGGGGLDLQLQLDPLAKTPTFELNAQVTNVTLVTLNDFLRAYAKFDVASGMFALYTSVAAKEERYEGYLKVFFEDLDVFAWEKERKKNALEVFWQAIVGTLTAVFKNQPTDRLATKIPIAGSYDGTDVGVWSAVTTLLRNAFVRALIPQLDQPVEVEDVEPPPKAAPKRPNSAPPEAGKKW